MKIEDYFSSNYTEARSRFLRLCRDNGFGITSYQNEAAQAPDGSDLVMDVATLGRTDAENLLVLSSGTHGVEGYCGSGIQSALVGESRLLPGDNLRIALVHAVNPFGFAHDRRVNEDNIDLNRNFLEFGKVVPSDNGYGDIHAWLVPEDWQGEARAEADRQLARYAAENGAMALQAAASGGQYTHPGGLFYGGKEPSWSARTILSIVGDLAASARRANFIDFHTGLGPYGHGEIINVGSAAQVERGFAFYPEFELTDPDAGTSSSAPVQGTLAHGVERALPNVQTVFIALEYGTQPMREVMTALRADNWLYQNAAVDSHLGKEIKQQVRNAFYCDEPEWKELIWKRAVEVVDATCLKLNAT